MPLQHDNRVGRVSDGRVGGARELGMTAICASSCHMAAYERRHWAVGRIGANAQPASVSRCENGR